MAMSMEELGFMKHAYRPLGKHIALCGMRAGDPFRNEKQSTAFIKCQELSRAADKSCGSLLVPEGIYN